MYNETVNKSNLFTQQGIHQESLTKENNNYFWINNENIINDYQNDFMTKSQVLELTNEMIKQCKNFENAVELVKNMKEVGIQPDINTYRGMISVCNVCCNASNSKDLITNLYKLLA